MQFGHASSAEPADWISKLTFREATTFGPPGFGSYARLRFSLTRFARGKARTRSRYLTIISPISTKRAARSPTLPSTPRLPTTATRASGTVPL